ncbi:trimeric LpxA-like protein [Pavlovales sp. CCMP2436]|nr:trimeric LpxA-like protein [Pavlovales sp. CCMP2436]|mmetsp:Transcript_11840/g.27656  ORF Transcript_11840/g.27656 Transcript_11840/m.27656 type:complete len:229 (+) Transcript_11840:183-869(+)
MINVRALARCPFSLSRARGLAIRTAVGEESCPRVEGPPADLHAAERRLAELRARFPRAFIERYLSAVPTVSSSVLVCAGAALVGDVTLGEGASVWFGCVLRADINRIVVGKNSNLQDGTVLHLGDLDATIIGEDVVVGHRAVLHGCTIEDACLIGMNATVLDGCTIGKGSIVGAGAVVPAGLQVPPNSLVLGLPAKIGTLYSQSQLRSYFRPRFFQIVSDHAKDNVLK